MYESSSKGKCWRDTCTSLILGHSDMSSFVRGPPLADLCQATGGAVGAVMGQKAELGEQIQGCTRLNQWPPLRAGAPQAPLGPG